MTKAETDAYRRGYQRGYTARSYFKWPEHKPPLPPNHIIAGLMKAASDLRNGIDGQLAMFGEDDEITKLLGPRVDEFDAAMSNVTEWLKVRDDHVELERNGT